MIYRATGIKIRAVNVMRNVYGLAVIELHDPEREGPYLRSLFHQSAWMSSEAVYWVDRVNDPDAPRKLLALRAFAEGMPQGCKRPRRLTTCEPWSTKRLITDNVFAS